MKIALSNFLLLNCGAVNFGSHDLDRSDFVEEVYPRSRSHTLGLSPNLGANLRLFSHLPKWITAILFLAFLPPLK
jgi:hypothetical protein